MILCREATRLHTDADEGALHGAKKAFYDLHMRLCRPCKRYRAQLRTTAAVLAGLPKEPPPAELVERLASEVGKTPK